MKKVTTLSFLILFLGVTEIVTSQMRNGARFGNQRGSQVPQAQTPPEPPKPKTADELVDEQMPRITEEIGLDPFEEAVVRSTLVKYVQKRLELQILKLEPNKMQEEFKKLGDMQSQELKAGLPEDKFLAYQELEQRRFQGKKKKKKKKKKSKE